MFWWTIKFCLSFKLTIFYCYYYVFILLWKDPFCFRYFYISLIREPISRFLSEFKHVQRGATWKNSRHWCGGRVASMEELPKCYSSSTWKKVSLNEFLSCPHNLAANRYGFEKEIKFSFGFSKVDKFGIIFQTSQNDEWFIIGWVLQ